MKKLFISVPMKGRTEAQIRATMEQMHHIAEAVFGEELEVIQTYISDDPPADANQAVWYLGESIKKMADADYFIGIYDEVMGSQLLGHDDVKGWLTARQITKMWRCRNAAQNR